MNARLGKFLLVLFFMAHGSVAAPKAGDVVSPGQALQKLLAGNRSFIENRLTIKESSSAARRLSLASGQHPYAVVLSCSDSRVPPEIIFNQGPGDLFVIRDAGNVVNPVVVGSIEYGVEHLGASLIMVLGHSRCGAVKAALDATGLEDPGIEAIIKKIAPSVQAARARIGGKDKARLLEAAIDFNIRASAQSLLDESPIIRAFVDSKRARIVCAKYDLDTGAVKLLSCK